MLQRSVLLAAHDQQWQRHLVNMELLQDDIWARVLDRVDPISEFRREASDLFQRMQRSIGRDTVELFFHATLG